MTPQYEMFTNSGNRACQTMVNRINKIIRGNKRVTKEKIKELFDKGREKIAIKHPEVHDTEPRYHIAYQISKALKDVGYSFYLDSWGDIADN